MSNIRKFSCLECKHEWIIPFGPILPGNCPRCGSIKFLAMTEAKGHKDSWGRGASTRLGRSLGRRKGEDNEQEK